MVLYFKQQRSRRVNTVQLALLVSWWSPELCMRMGRERNSSKTRDIIRICRRETSKVHGREHGAVKILCHREFFGRIKNGSSRYMRVAPQT